LCRIAYKGKVQGKVRIILDATKPTVSAIGVQWRYMMKAKVDRNSELILKKKAGWSFRQLAAHFNITVSRAFEIWESCATIKEKEDVLKNKRANINKKIEVKEKKEIINSLLKKNYSYAKIGRIIGLSRQRIHQILVEANK
jgi:hypothetical protein